MHTGPWAWRRCSWFWQTLGDMYKLPNVQAYLKGDTETLRQHCSPECLERMAGIIQAEQVAEARRLAMLMQS